MRKIKIYPRRIGKTMEYFTTKVGNCLPILQKFVKQFHNFEEQKVKDAIRLKTELLNHGVSIESASEAFHFLGKSGIKLRRRK